MHAGIVDFQWKQMDWQRRKGVARDRAKGVKGNKSMAHRRTIHSEYIYRGRVVTLRIDTVMLPDGRLIKREVVEHRGAVAIVPILDTKTVLLIRQFRQAVGETLLEIPAGTLEDDEDPDSCAARELEEETGYRAGSLQRLFSQYLAPGYSNEVLHVYCARDLTCSSARPDVDEEIELIPVRMADIETMIWDGRIRDAKSIAALLATLLLLRKE
jgi:ADP-ribose pyrophosphatase